MRTTDPVVVYKHIYAVPVWREERIVWFTVYTKQRGYYLGKIKDLYYLEEANGKHR